MYFIVIQAEHELVQQTDGKHVQTDKTYHVDSPHSCTETL